MAEDIALWLDSLYRLHRYAEAAEAFREARNELPLEQQAELGLALEHAGDLVGALQVWIGLSQGESGQFTPEATWWQAKYNHCRLLVRLDRREEAVQRIQALRHTTALGGAALSVRFADLELIAQADLVHRAILKENDDLPDLEP